MNLEKNFLVLLCAEPNLLSVGVLEQLLSNNCYINIVSENISGWEDFTSHIASKNKFSVLDSFKNSPNINYNYAIFCSGFTKDTDVQGELKKFLQLKNIDGIKTFIVLPQELYGILNINNPNFPDTIGIIYIKDILGPRVDLDSDLTIASHIREMCVEKVFRPKIGEVFSPLFAGDVARQIVKWLFAFGPFGKEILLQGEEISSNAFWQESSRVFGPIGYAPKNESHISTFPKNINRQVIKRRTGYILSETYKWISRFPLKKKSPKKIINVDRMSIAGSNLIRPTTLKSKAGIFAALGILAFPLVTLIINALIFVSLYKPLISKNSSFLSGIFNISKALSSISYKESSLLKRVPLLGQLYKETEFANYLTGEISDIAVRGAPIIRAGETLLKNTLGQDPYSVDATISDSAERLQAIYEVVFSIQNTAIVSQGKGSVLASYVLKKVDIDYYKNIVSQASIFAKNLPEILGEKGSRTYLVLFQNNMELRPTGGFIGSYGLITFDKGRLSDFAVSDIYSADGQLNGHVEPPLPIKNYLGEANWWFRDSNWDPDFPTSAKRAEWFLSKEMDIGVDGVVAVDLTPIKNFLEVAGPLYLSDYETEINSDNLYEKVQSEVENNFFPGTYKKGSFLSSLAKNILNEAKGLTSDRTQRLAKLIFSNLNSKDIQLYVHNTEVQDSLNALNWDGSIPTPFCGEGCFADLIGIVEANVGVNKSNFFITRKVDLNLVINNSKIDKKLTLYLNNSANKNLGVSGRYKSYIRFLVPEDSQNITVFSNYGQDRQKLIPEITDVRGHKEVGVLVEVLAGENRSIEFNWDQELSDRVGSYYGYFRKQAGVDNYPINISISSPIKILGSQPSFTLTDQGNYVYNTTLVKDLVFGFSI